VLRRTKGQVARELPERVEQTLVCDLGREERRLYLEIHARARASLDERIGARGIGRSAVHILEALLRLRQAACHPGLIDAERRAEDSAKLDVLLSHLESVRAEGRKALVFSQFATLLRIVKERLDTRGVVSEYLDGATTDRGQRVERFQTDPECSVFLLSLKAGGVGLNLTAADCVFLLDPWWNPAAEAQAIDRAHRIGQKRTVFAYRILARNTVEEKVAELQRTKRALADALFGRDSAPIEGMSREDLEMLLA
jgi:SNF2 family DNA or RNA helicase